MSHSNYEKLISENNTKISEIADKIIKEKLNGVFIMGYDKHGESYEYILSRNVKNNGYDGIVNQLKDIFSKHKIESWDEEIENIYNRNILRVEITSFLILNSMNISI